MRMSREALIPGFRKIFSAVEAHYNTDSLFRDQEVFFYDGEKRKITLNTFPVTLLHQNPIVQNYSVFLPGLQREKPAGTLQTGSSMGHIQMTYLPQESLGKPFALHLVMDRDFILDAGIGIQKADGKFSFPMGTSLDDLVLAFEKHFEALSA